MSHLQCPKELCMSAKSCALATRGGTSTHYTRIVPVRGKRNCSSLMDAQYISPSCLTQSASSICWGSLPLKVINQRPILSYSSGTPHGYSTHTGLIKPWLIMKACTTGLCGVVSEIVLVKPITKYHGGPIITLHAPCTRSVIHR